MLAGTPHAAPYVTVEAGLVKWPDTSNKDQLEADSAWGALAGIAAGVEGRLGRLELEFAHRVSKIHGFNRPDGYTRKSDGVKGARLSGDGNTLHTTSATVNVWPGTTLGARFYIYAGGGLGVAYLSALGDHALTPAMQIGGGLEIKAPDHVWVGLGYRYFRALEASLDGLETRYDTHGPIVRLTYGF